MTRRKTDPAPELPPDPDELEVYAEMQRLIAETGPGGARKIVVFKKRADGKPPDRCRQFQVAELERMDVIPEMFGGGEFILQMMDEANRYMKRFSVSWPVELYPVPQPVKPAEPAAAAPQGPGSDRIAELIVLMQRESQAAQERYTALLQSIVTSLIGRGAPTLKDRVDELLAIKQLGGDAQRAPVELLKDVLLAGLNVGRGGKPAEGAADGDAEDNGMMRVIDKGLDILNRAIDKSAKPAGAGGGPRPAVLPDHLRPYAWLLKYVPRAIEFAKGGISAERAAAALYALVPDDHLDVLESFVRMPAPERNQLLVQLDPRLAPYQAFLDELARNMVIVFEREGEDVEDLPRAAQPAQAG